MRIFLQKTNSATFLAVGIILIFAMLMPESAWAQEAPVSTEPAAGQVVSEQVPGKSFDERVNEAFAPISKWIGKFVFAGVGLEDGDGEPIFSKDGSQVELPLILLWLVGAALTFTLVFRFVNVRSLPLAYRTMSGKYSKDSDPGEITHFQALTAALSATVGLGNIAGVAIAVSMGGPGAVFWMILAGFLGMASKFAECTLGVRYRKIIDGKVYGGPMYYLRDGLAERDMPAMGKTLAVLFAIMCVGASLGGGNMFQANQSCEQVLGVFESDMHVQKQKDLAAAKNEREAINLIHQRITAMEREAKELREKMSERKSGGSASARIAEELLQTEQILGEEKAAFGDGAERVLEIESRITVLESEVLESRGFLSRQRWIFGLVMAVLVGLVIIGGISGIAKVTSKLVPFMTATYITGCLIVLGANFDSIGYAFSHIMTEAFNPESMVGGFIGVFIQGIRRAAFSNEAGFGSAPIAHAAVKTRYPASEGLVALIEPLVDTVVVCTMTGLAIVITAPDHMYAASEGIQLTSSAFETVIPWFKFVLLACVVLFAFSTMISWSYYGQQAWAFMFGRGKVLDLSYKLLFCIFVVIGASINLGSVIDFSDGMLFAMSIFNLIGVFMLLPVVKRELVRFTKFTKHVDAGGSLDEEIPEQK